MNEALVESLVEEFQHYSLFDRYYSLIVQTILNGVLDTLPVEERHLNFQSPRGKLIVNRCRRFFRELRQIIFPEARPFRATRLFLSTPTYSRGVSYESGDAVASVESRPAEGSIASHDLPLSQLTVEDHDDNENVYWKNEGSSQYFTLDQNSPSQGLEEPIMTCVLCQRNETEDMSRADGNTIVDGGCGCAACMCRGCWKEFFETNLTGPDIVFIACPVCKQNVLPHLELLFPDVHYKEDPVPADVREYWVAQIRGETTAPPGANPRRVCKLCNRVTDPPHTRRTCCFRELRRQFVEHTLQETRDELRVLESTLDHSRSRLQEAEDELTEAREEVRWNEMDMRDLRKLLQAFERELDEV